MSGRRNPCDAPAVDESLNRDDIWGLSEMRAILR
jgi:hypothetical protein